MKTIRDIQHLNGVKVLLRVDFNVPLQDNTVSDDFRIKIALPSISYLQEKGAKVIIITHLETNDGEAVSLKPAAQTLKDLGLKFNFIENLKQAHEVIEHEIEESNFEPVLLENLRFFEGEKKNDEKFAKELSSIADLYVNDAFPVSHRNHASVVGIPKYLPSFAGLQFEKEVNNLSKAFNPSHPFVFILGGAKFDTKIPLVEKFLNIADIICVCGALATDFYKAKGYETGMSLTSSKNLDLTKYLNNSKIFLPVDVADQNGQIYYPDKFPKEGKIQDAGPETMKLLAEKIKDAKLILWNGPLGQYEKGFVDTTLELAKLIKAQTEKGALSMVGGGDTVAAIEKLNYSKEISFISSGGGAMLDFLAKGTLPGLDALNQSEQ